MFIKCTSSKLQTKQNQTKQNSGIVAIVVFIEIAFHIFWPPTPIYVSEWNVTCGAHNVGNSTQIFIF